MQAHLDAMGFLLQPVVETATPGAGAYMNEADLQENFFGASYPNLLAIKKKYDPKGLLYTVARVGSEDWTVKNDGRMCRA
ncbi:Uncharacterized protein TPAR_08676 [Tolypocladium paradoxum]|uniref:Berberine/berberine-like domain-containing protein n=1 Tax=Tolypocladium paradoxum TaxID=94208 RepID=A0A2S4KLX1_9HYPO|nr:Uncharacterized protein TPAR_08676 [Tolypocladium paradoxum]